VTLNVGGNKTVKVIHGLIGMVILLLWTDLEWPWVSLEAKRKSKQKAQLRGERTQHQPKYPIIEPPGGGSFEGVAKGKR
jgi:hypothetical protein